MIKKLPVSVYISMAILMPFLIFISVSANTGYAASTFSGFGVDTKGYMYVGRDLNIEKYKGDELVAVFGPIKARSMFFTVDSDDTLSIATEGAVITMDSNGTILNERIVNPTRMQLYKELAKTTSFTAQNKETYSWDTSFLERLKVKNSDGTVVYKQPLRDYFARVIRYSMIVILPIFFIVMMIIIIKNPQPPKESRLKSPNDKGFTFD